MSCAVIKVCRDVEELLGKGNVSCVGIEVCVCSKGGLVLGSVVIDSKLVEN